MSEEPYRPYWWDKDYARMHPRLDHLIRDEKVTPKWWEGGDATTSEPDEFPKLQPEDFAFLMLILQCAWATTWLQVALWYLTNDFLKSLTVTAFVGLTLCLRLARRPLLVFSLAVVAIAGAVYLGAPHPSQWGDIISRSLHPQNVSLTEPQAR